MSGRGRRDAVGKRRCRDFTGGRGQHRSSEQLRMDPLPSRRVTPLRMARWKWNIYL